MKTRDYKADYDAVMYEIGEIVRVARDNANGLRKFLMKNYPKQWGLTEEQHKIILAGGQTSTKGRHSYDRSKPDYRCRYCGDPCPYGAGNRLRRCPGTPTKSTDQATK